MKKLFSSTKVFLVAFLVVAFISCSAEDGKDGINGAIGPQGPAGQDGEDGMNGATGPQGEPGADGQDGGVNLSYTAWFNFQDTTTRTDYFFLQSLVYGFLSDNYIDTGGSVLVYMGWVSTAGLTANPVHPDEIVNLPKFDNNGSTNWEVTHRLNTGPSSGSVELIIDVGSTTATSRNDFLMNYFYRNNRFFRIIFIPGGTALSGKKEIVDFNDYKAVKEYYKIPD